MKLERAGRLPMRVLAVFDVWRRVSGISGRLRADLPHCHWLTWCMTLLVALAIVLIVVPGDHVDWRFREAATPWERRSKGLHAATLERHEPTMRNLSRPGNLFVWAFEHGWPRPFLARALVQKPTADGGEYRVRSTHLIRYVSPFRSWGGSLYL
ncbi:MAG: hypothetical protein ACREHD_18825, partial [Pirellulales bacterium]